MNSKKKNKNRQHKPQNPTPPQKPVVPEKIEQSEKPESVVEIVERVPEIISDVVPVDVKETEDEPKKPKRNRGKKKKQDDTPEDGDQEIKVVETAAEEIIATEDIKVIENVEIQKEILEDTNITPTARKKKNKKKKTEAAVEEPAATEKIIESPIEVAKEPEPKIEDNIVKDDPLISDGQEQEFKVPKKKNKKKKNRNDSEKSDKGEISCTAAFEQILADKSEEIKSESKQDEKVEDSSTSEATVSTVKEVPIDKSKDLPTEESPFIMPSEPLPVQNIEQQKDVVKEENKGKKKKKDKKQPPNVDKEETNKVTESQPIETNISSVQETLAKAATVIAVPLISDIIPEIIAETTKIENVCATKEKSHISIDETTKTKDKPIIKEKSPKLKEESSKREESPFVKEKSPKPKEENTEIKDVPISKEKSPKPKEETPKTQNIPIAKEKSPKPKDKSTKTEEIPIMEDKTPKPKAKIAKPVEKKEKSKKEPKHAKEPQVETVALVQEEKIEPPKIEDDDGDIIFCPITEDFDDILVPVEAPKPATDTNIPIEKPEKQVSSAVKVEEKKEMKTETLPANIPLPESGMGKKRKKSPKPKGKVKEVTSIEEILSEPIPTNIQDAAPKKEEQSSDKSAEAEKKPSETTQAATVPTERLTDSCLGIPDLIEYPRSTSEQLLDGNNNTLIREILAEQAKLEANIAVPDIPLIQRPKETLTAFPESSIYPIKTSDLTPPTGKEDKTDLKSKVMEVNQDMEELRKSIERSLAGFTALEKSDAKFEKEMEEKSKNKHKLVETQAVTDMPATESKEIKSEVETILPKPAPETITVETKTEEPKTAETVEAAQMSPPICPSRKDNKGKGKSKKKGKQEQAAATTATSTTTTTTSSSTTETSKETKDSSESKQKEKTEQSSEKSQEKGKQQSGHKQSEATDDFEPIENFEDALTSSVEDVNQTFEVIANDANPALETSQNNPEIKIIAPTDDTDKSKKQEKVNPVSQPKNLLGHPDIPVPSNKTDYKKEKNRLPNERQAKVKVKDAVLIEDYDKNKKESKESQTENKIRFSKDKTVVESIACVTTENEEYVYKYSFRKVFLPSACHVCRKDLKQSRIACIYCNLVFYCSPKHKDEDWAQHQALCFAVSTIFHLKEQKHIYADAKDVLGQNYRLLRMQAIVSCEKVLKRKLMPWEQEALLYPRICADSGCRAWRQSKLKDCEGCGQIFYCIDHPDHFPKAHQRWCKSYALYHKLVCHQQTKGRLEPKLPTRVMKEFQVPGKMNEVLASLYEDKIDVDDMQYAALTQLATAPLTALHCYQLYNDFNGKPTLFHNKRTTFTIHCVGAELQFEADSLHKWEVFALHLLPHAKLLKLVMIGQDLNTGNLPLDLLGKIKLCDNCRQNDRRVEFSFQDKTSYYDYWASDEFVLPDIVCAFNPSIQRSSVHNGKDPWPSTINCVLKQKVPFLVTAYTMQELKRDVLRINQCAEVGVTLVADPQSNTFASVRPDRNFITDDEMPLLFKNYCFTIVCGAC